MKESFSIKKINKKESSDILNKYHYLSNISKGFKSGFNYGLFMFDELVGVCIFTGFPVPELSKGMLGLERDDQKGLFELSRLCLEPKIQKSEHNLASWFVSRCLHQLKNDTDVRVVLSYADDGFHKGTVYRACNFKYYGLTSPKKDFWILNDDGSYTKHSRGKTKGVKGEWRNRNQKHRFIMNYDKSLTIRWEQ